MMETKTRSLTLVSSWKELEELIDALLLRISDTDLHLAAMHFARVEGE
jgi:hypothetical protein